MKKILKSLLFIGLLSINYLLNGQTTPNGTNVSQWVAYYPELTGPQIAWVNAKVALDFPNVVKLAEPTRTYNCHGYAWIKSDGGGTYWLNDPGDNQFWQDNSYVQTSNTTNASLRVSFQGDHTAVTTSTSGVCISKWGPWGLYQHNTTNVPVEYQPNNTLTYYARNLCSAAPNLQNMTYDWGSTVNTVNFVSSGGHNVYSNINPATLSQSINWSPNNSNAWFYGQNNVNASFNLGSGQSITFFMSATNPCGTSTRNPTFVAQSGWRMYANTEVKDIMYIGFDNVEYLETLPTSIIISDEKSGKNEMEISMKELFDRKQFDKDKRIAIDVRKLSRGVKIIGFIYPQLDSKDQTQFERKTDRAILID